MNITLTIAGIILSAIIFSSTEEKEDLKDNSSHLLSIIPQHTPDTLDSVRNKEGIRFLYLGNPSRQTFYIPINDTIAIRHNLYASRPGFRMEFPENGKLQIYTQPIVTGQHQNLLISADIPEKQSGKMICIIVGNKDGAYPIFINDGDLHKGMIKIKNATNKSYKLEIPTASEGDLKETVLDPDDELSFGANLLASGQSSQTFGVTLKHKFSVDGKETDWLHYRKFMIQSSPDKYFIKLLVNHGSSMMVHDIIFFPEYFSDE